MRGDKQLSTYCCLPPESLLHLYRLHIFSRKLLVFMKSIFMQTKVQRIPSSRSPQVFQSSFCFNFCETLQSCFKTMKYITSDCINSKVVSDLIEIVLKKKKGTASGIDDTVLICFPAVPRGLKEKHPCSFVLHFPLSNFQRHSQSRTTGKCNTV